ncbi:MAG: hypothetical protein ACKVOO_10950 [Burkholderiaceae bacterium]
MHHPRPASHPQRQSRQWRFFNGTADTHDSIVGLTLDRGYTLHKH